MAALDATMPTMLDFAKLTGPDGKLTPLSEIVPILNLTDMVFPRIRWMPANGKFGHLTTYDTELPEGDFTGFNGYSLPTKGTTAQSTDGLAHYQDYSSVDKFLAEAHGDVDQYRLIQDAKHMQGAVHKFMRTWIYGNAKTAPKSFTGLAARYAAKFGATATETAENIVLGGAAALQTDSTSIYILNMGRMGGVAGIYQPNTMAGFQIKDLQEQTEQHATLGLRQVLRTHYRWSCGQTIPDWRKCARIANIDTGALTAAGNGSNDTDLAAKIRWAVDLLPPDAEGETVILGNRLVSQWLNQQVMTKVNGTFATYENVGGKQIMMVAGLPFLRCDSILSTETAMATS